MAVKHHPDKGGDEQKFKELSEAYEILAELPLLQFMNVKLYELTYNEYSTSKIPKLSLN